MADKAETVDHPSDDNQLLDSAELADSLVQLALALLVRMAMQANLVMQAIMVLLTNDNVRIGI
jgi:hypothetical protein